MGVFQSCGWTWDFEMGIGALRMSCRSVYYPDLLKNLHNLPCIGAFSQTLQPILQPFTQIIEQGCSTNAWKNYKWFDVNTALCCPCYPLEFVSLQANTLFSTHPSRCYKPLTHPVNTSKKKKDLQTVHSNRLSSFYPGTHHRSAFSKSSEDIIPAWFKDYYIP